MQLYLMFVISFIPVLLSYLPIVFRSIQLNFV